ncbi:MAG: sulfur oxidation c-type cytochrome SoxA [Hylemonella sp.]
MIRCQVIQLHRLFLAIACWVAVAAVAQTDTRRSGFEFMRPDTQAMQRDDTLNPGMLWVRQGEKLWQQASASGAKSCAGCHGDASSSMHGVAARYPAWDERTQGPLNLAQRINQCRQNHQQTQPWRLESQELLALESFVGYQSRGMPLAPQASTRLQPHLDNGQRLFQQRMGQLNLSCAQCHDQNAGRHLGGNVIPQAHPTGYPIYRLEWQAVGSLQRRLRNCMNGVRAEPYAMGARELVELELYLAVRARGMPVETPGIRP